MLYYIILLQYLTKSYFTVFLRKIEYIPIPNRNKDTLNQNVKEQNQLLTLYCG